MTGQNHLRSNSLVAERVAELGLLAQTALRFEGRGRIVAAFERCFYAVLDDRWICVGSKALGSGPLHVLCENWSPRALSTGNDVAVAGTVLHVNGEPLASFDAASIWAPEPAPVWSPGSVRAGLRAVDALWSAASTDEGLAALGLAQPPAKPSQLLRAAAPGVAALNRIIAAGLQGSFAAPTDRAALAELIGLGPGLTPSGDDTILGALVALASLGFCDARDTLWEACRGQLDRTNEISRAHLEAASLGCGAAVLHAAIHSTMSGRVAQVEPALAALSAIGHSSGRDGFAGVLIVLRAAVRHSERG